MIISYYSCRGSGEEHQSGSRGLWDSCLARVSRFVQSVSSNVGEISGYLGGPRELEQCSYLDVDEDVKSHKIICKQIVRRGTMTPYVFKFCDPSHIITGIACGPQDDKTSSPELEVVDGGIKYHHVVIRLSPVQGPWACCIEISGIEENSVQMT